MPLTPRQAEFVRQYLLDLNATAAYERAGYRARGNVAKAAASRLLTDVNVKEAIAAARGAQQERTEVNMDYVIRGLQREADRTGEGSSHAARVSALSWLGKHFGGFVDRHQVEGGLSIEYVIGLQDEAPQGLQSPGERSEPAPEPGG